MSSRGSIGWRIVGVGSALHIGISAFFPWYSYRVAGVTRTWSGFSLTFGVITLLAAILISLVLVRGPWTPRTQMGALAIGVLVILAGMISLNHPGIVVHEQAATVANASKLLRSATPGFGIYGTIAGGIGLVLASVNTVIFG